ncbi:nitroreductase family protein [Desulfomarina sp.]
MEKLVEATRTYRRFYQNHKIEGEFLHGLINLARLGGSARNCQPWQYMVVNDMETCEKIFPYLGWAGYLADWKGPVAGERPSAYIICLLNRERLTGSEAEAQFDLGIASQNIMLGAMQHGIGGCRIASIGAGLSRLFIIPAHLKISLVIALGKPKETVVLEECSDDSAVRYWRDEEGLHHVPKRTLASCLVELQPAVKPQCC